ncbi:MAG: type 4a pilus biogenesis protein PilO [Chitinivibrionales bacterium]|nr:type 4a pilus biogenesis protein PilO [Chitinivibrionales bacterium]
MHKLTNLCQSALLHRWWLLPGLIIVLSALLVRTTFMPILISQWQSITTIKANLQSVKNAPTLPIRSRKIAQQSALIDSLIHTYKNRPRFNQAVMIGNLYKLADSSKCNAQKVEIDDPISVESMHEIPIFIKGTGNYRSIGTFVAHIENLPYATRIRQLTMSKNEGQGIDFALDFLVVEKP